MGSITSHKKRMEKQASIKAVNNDGVNGINDTDAEAPSAIIIANPDSFLNHSQTSFNFSEHRQMKSQLDESGNHKLYDPTKPNRSKT